jgi:hypothetical protein
MLKNIKIAGPPMDPSPSRFAASPPFTPHRQEYEDVPRQHEEVRIQPARSKGWTFGRENVLKNAALMVVSWDSMVILRCFYGQNGVLVGLHGVYWSFNGI